MGVKKSCFKWKKVSARTAKGKKAAFRCAAFKKGLARPTCPTGGLRGGGRSQNYIRNKASGCTGKNAK